MEFDNPEINKVYKSVLTRHNLDFIKVGKTEEEGYLMSLDVRDMIIKINEQALDREYSRRNFPMNFARFTEILFYHEIGHYLDGELEEISDRLNLNQGFLDKGLVNGRNETKKEMIDDFSKAEGNAWRIAEALSSNNKFDRGFQTLKDYYLEESKRYHTKRLRYENNC